MKVFYNFRDLDLHSASKGHNKGAESMNHDASDETLQSTLSSSTSGISTCDEGISILGCAATCKG